MNFMQVPPVRVVPRSGVLYCTESLRPSRESLRRRFLYWCHGRGLLLVLYELRSCYHRIRQGRESKQTLALDKVRLSIPALPTFDGEGNRIDKYAYNEGIQALSKARPWLTLGDFELFLQGWLQAEKCICGTQDTQAGSKGFDTKPRETPPLKAVENVSSWQEALAFAKRRIKELRFSERVFKRMIADGKPWPGSQTDATRN